MFHRRAVLNILLLTLQLSFTGADQCAQTYEYNGKQYSKECICADVTYSSWCKGKNQNTKLMCGLQERDRNFKVPQCGVTVNKCPNAGYFYSEATGQCYGLQRTIRSWDVAKAECEAYPGGQLARLTKDASNQIKDYFVEFWDPKFEENFWIGLTDDPRQDGIFEWVGKSPQVENYTSQLNWTNWANGRPTTGDDRHCVEILTKDSMKWNNAPCTRFKPSLCESARLCTVSNCRNGSDCVTIKQTSQLCCVGQLCCVDNAKDYCFDGNNNCQTNPCKNGGTCVSRLNAGIRCSCLNGFTGTLCEMAIDYCQTKPCKNGGICESLVTTFNCTCKGGFQGNTCENTTDYCQTKPCKNGGICESLVTTFNCTCKGGFQGNTCENTAQDISPCTSNPCKNNAVCTGNATVGWVCMCAAGYTGAICDSADELSHCSPPCQNGGTCSLMADTNWQCTCVPGFSGQDCGSNVDGSPATTGSGNLEINNKIGVATNLQPRGGITSLLSICAILWVYYDQTAIISLFMI